MNERESKYPGGGVLPQAYLGHSHGICEHLSSNHNLSQALTASLPAKLSRQAGGCRRLSAMKIFYVNIICGPEQKLT